MVEVFAIKILKEENYFEVRKKLLSLLPESQVSNIQRFKRMADEQRSLLGEVLSRHIISRKTGIEFKDLKIEKSKKGKPNLLSKQDIFFNISHSGQWVVSAIAENPVGIDVEELKEPVYRIAERYFSKVELEKLNQLSGATKQSCFFDLWTLKESYLKMLGKGLTKSLGSFSIIGNNGEFKLLENSIVNNKVFFRQYNVDPLYKLSVCSLENNFVSNVQLIVVDQLLNQNFNGK